MAKSKQKKRVVRAWTKADVKILRSIGKDQLSTKQAAKQLGRTVGALYQKRCCSGSHFAPPNANGVKRPKISGSCGLNPMNRLLILNR